MGLGDGLLGPLEDFNMAYADLGMEEKEAFVKEFMPEYFESEELN